MPIIFGKGGYFDKFHDIGTLLEPIYQYAVHCAVWVFYKRERGKNVP